MSNGQYTVGWSDPAGVFGAGGSGGGGGFRHPVLKAEGALTPYGEVMQRLEKLEYILQRIAPDYDELVTQYNALKDIENSNKRIKESTR
jgi:hypothetical protein